MDADRITEGGLSMSHYEFQGTLLKCLCDIDECFGFGKKIEDLGCKTRIVIDVEDGKVEKENL